MSLKFAFGVQSACAKCIGTSVPVLLTSSGHVWWVHQVSIHFVQWYCLLW